MMVSDPSPTLQVDCTTNLFDVVLTTVAFPTRVPTRWKTFSAVDKSVRENSDYNVTVGHSEKLL